MVVALDREGFESPLIEMARPDRMSMRVPPLGVGHRQPTHEPREVSIGAGPENQMEVVGHDAVCQEPHGVARDRLAQDALEGEIIRRGVKNAGAGVGAVDRVVDDSTFLCSNMATHGPFVLEPPK